jgi:hypothetical protein
LAVFGHGVHLRLYSSVVCRLLTNTVWYMITVAMIWNYDMED